MNRLLLCMVLALTFGSCGLAAAQQNPQLSDTHETDAAKATVAEIFKQSQTGQKITPEQQAQQAKALQEALAKIIKSAQEEAAKMPPPTAAQIEENHKKLELILARNRTAVQRFLNDFSLLFPAYMGASPGCYQAAFSTYVEDRWHRAAEKSGCASIDKACGPPRDPSVWMGADPATAIRLNNTWVTSAAAFKNLRPIIAYLSPDDEPDAFDPNRPRSPPIGAAEIDQAMPEIAEINHLVAHCGSFKPAPWAVVDAPLSYENLTRDAIKLGIYGLLAVNELAAKLPQDKKGYAGCLQRVTRNVDHVSEQSAKSGDRRCGDDLTCVETVPVDDKDKLLSVLDDLKTHQCDNVYIAEANFTLSKTK